MGNSSNESFNDFLESLKQAGIKIDNEQELKERLAEASYWRYAFRTIAANGRAIGIKFCGPETGSNFIMIRRTLDRFRFPAGTLDILAASLKAH
jgi:hypothetical protein